MLLNEETGYFHQVPGWDLNCAVVGAVLAELSLRSRIDTDMKSLFLLDQTETGNPTLDPILREIASEPKHQNTQYWIEHLASRAEAIIDSVLDRLTELKILEHHDGEFWTLARTDWQMEVYSNGESGTANQFIRTRISRAIFMNEIPDPRDVIVISLINTCDVFRFMFQLDDEAEKRIEAICQMDLIGRSIADAVVQNQAGPLLQRSHLTKGNSGCFDKSAAAQSQSALRQHTRALWRYYKRVWPGVHNPSALCETPDLPLRNRDKPLGAQARPHVSESQGLLCRFRESIRGIRAYCLPWMAAIISGSARPCLRRIHAAGWQGNWTSSTPMPEDTCRTGMKVISILQGACADL